jgi:hypothetical protein
MVVRALFAVVAAAVVVALGAIQFTAATLLRGDAQPGSLLRTLPDGTTREALAGGRAPTPALRLLLARVAVAGAPPDVAQRYVEALPQGAERASLEGTLAEAGGDHAAATAAYLAAGDWAGLEREAQRIETRGDTAGAVVLRRVVVARLARDPTEPDALAEAWWKLGLAEQMDGYHHYPIDSRRPWVQRAMADYEHAVTLAPLSERYLIAAGSQEINLADDAAARAYFERARDADPTSAQAWAGLAEVALRAHDTATARADLARARRLGPALPQVERLDEQLGR